MSYKRYHIAGVSDIFIPDVVIPSGGAIFAGTFAVGTIYAKGEEVLSEGQLFSSLVDGNIGNVPTPDTGDAFWAMLASNDRPLVVTSGQSGNAIGQAGGLNSFFGQWFAGNPQNVTLAQIVAGPIWGPNAANFLYAILDGVFYITAGAAPGRTMTMAINGAVVSAAASAAANGRVSLDLTPSGGVITAAAGNTIEVQRSNNAIVGSLYLTYARF